MDMSHGTEYEDQGQARWARAGRTRLSLRTAHQVNLISPLPARVPLTVDAFIALP